MRKFEIYNRIGMLNKYSNVDAYYGPYEADENHTALQVACSEIPIALRDRGLTIGIINGSGEVEEYWWNTDNITDDGLVKKSSNEDISISIPAGAEEVTENPDGKTFSLTYILQGHSIFNKGFLYINGSVAAEFTPVASTNGVTETFLLPQQIGIYTCQIAVTDFFGQRVVTDNYTLSYGTISAYFNTTVVENIIPKSQYTLNGAFVQATINTIDKSLYTPNSIVLGNDVLYTDFNESDTYPKTVNIYLPDNLSIQQNVSFGLVYNNAQLISDRYVFSIIGQNDISISCDDSFSGFVNSRLQIPMVVESGNPTFVFNITAQIGDQTFVYTDAPGNALVNFPISRLPDLVPQGEDQTTIDVVITATNKTDPTMHTSKTIELTLHKVTSLEPRIESANYFIFNTRQGLLQADTFTSTIEDYYEDGQSPNTPITYYHNQDTLSFGSAQPNQIIFDTYVNINKTGINAPVMQLCTSEGDVFGEITEEYVKIGDLVVNIFLDGEYKHIGIVYNKQELSEINGQATRYNAIYIDGCIVANMPTIGEYRGSYITINPEQSAVFDMASIHAYGYGTDDFPQSFDNYGQEVFDMLYKNYVSNLTSVPSQASCAKLQLINVNNLIDNPRSYNKDLRRLVPIGNVSEGKVTGAGAIDTLLKMNTASKSFIIEGKKQLKAVAAFCYYHYVDPNTDTDEKGIVEMHTQGTSTLDYPVPNFKFTFYNTDGSTTKVQKVWVSDIPEKDLTAKADYMDSSHLNNTPTCIFYNSITGNQQLMNSIIPEGVLVDAQSYARSHQITYDGHDYYYSDAIFGAPCIIEYTDVLPDVDSMVDLDSEVSFENTDFINLGSFMLNTDKSAKSLGLDIIDDSQDSYLYNNDIDVCYSLEGKSNIDTADDEGTQDPNAALFLYIGEVINKIPALDWNFTIEDWNALSIEDLLKFKTFIFDSTAFEYRSDLDPEDWETIEDLRKYLYPIARMWYFVARSTNQQFKENFDSYFNRNYAFLYYIDLICFAQVDNLGKNSMFDTWDGLIWYPRPYDLDSQCGFNNQGLDLIKTYEEILPTDTFASGALNHKTDLNTVNDQGEDTTQETIANLNNKNFSSKSSGLWSKLWNNFSDEIIAVYGILRENNYSANDIISNAKYTVIEKISPNLYNIDFRKKYLGVGAHQRKGFGNRWDKFRWWITKRFDFCDTYFKYANTINFTGPGGGSCKIFMNTPQYVHVTDDYTSRGRQLALEYAQIYYAQGVVEHVVLSTNNVTEIQGAKNLSTFEITTASALSDLKLNNLLTLDMSGNTYGIDIDNLYTQFNVLRTIDISNSTIKISKLPNTVQNFYADGVIFGDSTNPLAKLVSGRWESNIDEPEKCRLTHLSLKGFNGALVLQDLTLLEDIDISDANIKYLRLENLPNLKTLNITGCKFSGNVDIISISKDTLDFSNCDFNNNNLNFSGSGNAKITIDNLILRNVSRLDNISLDSLNIQSLDCTAADIKHIYIDENSAIQKFIVPPTIQTIGSRSASVDGVADMSKFTGLTLLSFSGCDYLTQITNLTYTGTGNQMFYRCMSLLSITNSKLNITTTCLLMFAHCYRLTTITSKDSVSPIIIDPEVTVADRMFANTVALPISTIQRIINTTSNLKNMRGCCTSFIGQSINLDDFFGDNEPTNISYLFSRGFLRNISVAIITGGKGIPVPDPVLTTVTGQIPSSVVDASMVFTSQTLLENIPANIFQNASNVTSYSYAFTGTAISTIYSSNFFGPCTSTLTSIANTFSNCKNLALNLLQTNVFRNYPNLTNVASVFGGCTNVMGDISNIFDNNPALQQFEHAFNGTSVSLTGRLRQDGFSFSGISIGSMFANNKSVAGINIEVLLDFPTTANISCNTTYSVGGGGARHEDAGVFEKCNKLLGSVSNISNILEGRDCSRMFKDCGSEVISILSDNITTIDSRLTLTLPNVSSARKMFMGCSFALSPIKSIVFGNTKDLRAMFCGTMWNITTNVEKMQFNDYNELLDYLFAASDISFNVSNLVLPKNVESTRYMFSYHAPFKGNDFVISSSRTQAYIDSEYYLRGLAYGLAQMADHFEIGASQILLSSLDDSESYPDGSNIIGVLRDGCFGTEQEPLTKLAYTAHMFDRSTITQINTDVFKYCPNIVDCRYMFSKCRGLYTTNNIDLFSADSYDLLTDVTGLFYNSSLDGEVRLSLTNARNLERADCMFGLIFPQGATGLIFTKTLFDENNVKLRSISGFATYTLVTQWPNLTNGFANVQFAQFAFARANFASSNIGTTMLDSNTRFPKLKNMVGMFARSSNVSSTNFTTMLFASSVVKTGNFYGVEISGTNINTEQYYTYTPSGASTPTTLNLETVIPQSGQSRYLRWGI